MNSTPNPEGMQGRPVSTPISLDETPSQSKRRIAANARQKTRRREIADAAAMIFQTYGYHATSVGDIADEAGISKPMIYHYFESKEDILVYIHELIAERLVDDNKRASVELDDPLDRLRALCESFFVIFLDLQPHIKTFFASFGQVGGEQRARIEARRLELSTLVEEVIADCVASGSFREVDPRVTMLLITGVFNWAPNWYNPAGSTSPSQMAEFVFDIIVKGLGQESSHDS